MFWIALLVWVLTFCGMWVRLLGHARGAERASVA